MRCPECGNDVPAGFEFCGYCGSSLKSSADAFAGDQLAFPQAIAPQFQNMRGLPHISTPSPDQAQPQPSTVPDALARSTATLNSASQPHPPDVPDNLVSSISQADQAISDHNLPPPPTESFYRDATEAIMMPPVTSGPLPVRQSGQLSSQPRYGFPGPTIAGHQPFRSDDPYAPTSVSHPPSHALSSATPQISNPGYGYANNSQLLYGTPPSSQPLYGTPSNGRYYQGMAAVPPQKRPTQNSTPLVISICLVVLVIIIIGAAVIYQGSRPRNSQSNDIHATSTATVIHAGGIEAPPARTSTPALTPTPVPDAGFIWCGLECAPSGFMDEYPIGWQMSPLTGIIGMQFMNPQQPDQLALFKTQANPTTPADAILLSELQSNYASHPGYQAPNPPNGQVVTIAGETWSSSSILYQGSNQQVEQVTAYVTVHQGKAFILEVQAAQAQFAQVSTAYYNIMIGKFQFM